MAIIVVDQTFLQSASVEVNSGPWQRIKKQLVDRVRGSRSKANRSPFPDRVWARHSALLNAARVSSRDKHNA